MSTGTRVTYYYNPICETRATTDTGNFETMASLHPPTHHRAIVVGDGDRPQINDNVELPKLRSDEFLIRTDAVAVNPSDTKMLGAFATLGGVLGTDYAGTVVALGSEVTSVSIGDRVCGAQNAMNANSPLRGSFGEYNVSAGKIWLKLPSRISSEGGSSFGAGISTAGLGIKLLQLPLPEKPVLKPAFVLVYGGSTATATVAIQFLRL
jgi:NADPH:quinone reductase-like Zn-dependent oxidoreductase